MAKKKRLHASDNPDPSKYIIVHTKEGDYLRRIRTSKNINAVFTENKSETCSAAAKQILDRLKPFTQGFSGRMNVRIAGRMRVAKPLCGKYDYSQLKGFDLQKFYPLDQLYIGHYMVKIEHGMINLEVPVWPGCMKAHNSLVTAFYFEAVLLTGNAMDPQTIRIEDERSEYFSFQKDIKETCNFSFHLPVGLPFMLFLKAGCLEGSGMAVHPKHYGMRIVAIGEGEA